MEDRIQSSVSPLDRVDQIRYRESSSDTDSEDDEDHEDEEMTDIVQNCPCDRPQTIRA